MTLQPNVPGAARTKLAFAVALVATGLGSALAQSAADRAELPTLKVGDRWKYEQRDRRTGLKESEFDRRIVAVTAAGIEGTENDGKLVLTPDLNVVESSIGILTGDVRYLAFPLEVGKKWDFKFGRANKQTGASARWQVEAVVTAYEKVNVRAGEFDAFRIDYKGFWNSTSGRNGRSIETVWYAPATRSVVKSEYDDTFNRNSRELVEFQLQPP